MKLRNNQYDILKRIALIITPLITFLAAIGDIWGIPHMMEITATLAAVDALIGSLLQISSNRYYKSKEGDDGPVSQ